MLNTLKIPWFNSIEINIFDNIKINSFSCNLFPKVVIYKLFIRRVESKTWRNVWKGIHPLKGVSLQPAVGKYNYWSVKEVER